MFKITDELIQKYRTETGGVDWSRLYGENTGTILDELSETTPRKIVELQDLHIFKLADELSDYIWNVVARWDYFSKKTLGDQYVRAADSVAANIAEGYGRYFFGEYVVFLYYSRGSLQETWLWTEKARRRGLLGEEDYRFISGRLEKLPKELNATIRTVKDQQKKWARRR